MGRGVRYWWAMSWWDRVRCWHWGAVYITPSGLLHLLGCRSWGVEGRGCCHLQVYCMDFPGHEGPGLHLGGMDVETEWWGMSMATSLSLASALATRAWQSLWQRHTMDHAFFYHHFPPGPLWLWIFLLLSLRITQFHTATSLSPSPPVQLQPVCPCLPHPHHCLHW